MTLAPPMNRLCLAPRDGAPRISPLLVKLTRIAFQRSLRRHFHAVRLLGPAPRLAEDAPLLIFLNHASWWDPGTCVLLAQRFFPERRHFAPMDAVAATRYRFLQKIGLFPVEAGTRAGAAAFLRTGQAVLTGGGVLWVTPQGRFSDARQRPAALRPGVSHFARRIPGLMCVPLAIEYTFWNQRLPEVLLTFGQTLQATGDGRDDLSAFEVALQSAQNRLATAARQRDPALFQTLLAGRGGTHPVYDAFRKCTAIFRRRSLELRQSESP